MGIRHLLPGVGRFTSRDVLLGDTSNPVSLNQYGYGDANPVTMVDPTGMLDARFGPVGGGGVMTNTGGAQLGAIVGSLLARAFVVTAEATLVGLGISSQLGPATIPVTVTSATWAEPAAIDWTVGGSMPHRGLGGPQTSITSGPGGTDRGPVVAPDPVVTAAEMPDGGLKLATGGSGGYQDPPGGGRLASNDGCSDDVGVIGRWFDTEIANDWPGHKVWGPQGEWDPVANEAWVESLLVRKMNIYVASPMTFENVWNSDTRYLGP